MTPYWVKVKKSKKLEGITHIQDGAGAWVPRSELGKVEEILGALPPEPIDDYSKVKRPNTNHPIAIMVLFGLAREIADVCGFKSVYTVHSLNEASETVRSNGSNLIVVFGEVPGGTINENKLSKVESLQFGDFITKVPASIKERFYRANILGKAKEIRDDQGIIVGYSCGNTIYFSFPICEIPGGADSGWYPITVARHVLSRALTESIITKDEKIEQEKITDTYLKTRKETLEKSRKSFITSYNVSKVTRIGALTEEIARLHEEISRIAEEIAAVWSKKEEKERQLSLEQGSLDSDELGNKEYDRIIDSLPDIESLTFTGDKMVATTREIWLIEDVAKEKRVFEPFPLGMFEISCTIGSSPKFKNLTKRLKFDGSTWDAPHVRDGTPCLGNISYELSVAAGKRRWFDVLLLCTEFLRNWTSSDSWGRIAFPHFKEAAGKASLFPIKDNIKLRAAEWVKHFPPISKPSFKIGDVMVAECPSTCMFRSGKCKCIQNGEYTREATVADILDDGVRMTWEIEAEGEKIQVGCAGFHWDNLYKKGTRKSPKTEKAKELTKKAEESKNTLKEEGFEAAEIAPIEPKPEQDEQEIEKMNDDLIEALGGGE